MDARRESEATPMKNRTTVERKSERELVVTRTFDAPARPSTPVTKTKVRGSSRSVLIKCSTRSKALFKQASSKPGVCLGMEPRSGNLLTN